VSQAPPILPPSRLGILGGGQLGRLFTQAARAMGYRVTVLDPAEHPPAAALADAFVRAAYDDRAALAELSRTCAAVTSEFENVDAQALRWLAEQVPVRPSWPCIATTQDRIAEKALLATAEVPIAPYAVVNSAAALEADLSPLLPGILKTARLGYDGKGQRKVRAAGELAAAFRELGSVPCVLEKQIELSCELSAIVARGEDGAARPYPVIENHHVGGILDCSILPARVDGALAAKAQEIALALAQRMQYVGVLAVEFFVTRDGALLVNELAPRPHNSGHATIEACVTSQFEQQVRALCGLPLGAPDLVQSAVMVNLLGELWRPDGTPPPWDRVLGSPSAKLYLYGKDVARRGRKMGHYCVLAERDQVYVALRTAEQIKQRLLKQP
jgi:5-(carboxyamino)imidazole ribonucleotide synthase